jgi:hypothetical protein
MLVQIQPVDVPTVPHRSARDLRVTRTEEEFDCRPKGSGKGLQQGMFRTGAGRLKLVAHGSIPGQW